MKRKRIEGEKNNERYSGKREEGTERRQTEGWRGVEEETGEEERVKEKERRERSAM